MRPVDEIIVKDLDVPCGFWSFAVRAYPFQIPETIASGQFSRVPIGNSTEGTRSGHAGTARFRSGNSDQKPAAIGLTFRSRRLSATIP
jgi:hypothetical protein